MINYSEIFQSPLFTFLVGEEETPLTIHAAALKGLSDPLNAMINNGTMKESTSGIAVLKDIDVEIFTAFCEYAYSSNFSVTRAHYVNQKFDEEMTGDKSHTFTMKTHTEADESDESDEYDEHDENHENHDGEAYCRWDLELLLDYCDFDDRKFKKDSRWGIRIKKKDFVFIVRVYVFATRYLIEPLRQYCLGFLHDKLCDTEMTDENSGSILDLLEYTYLHTSSQEPSGPSLMRDLVIHYVACKFTILSRNEDLGRLLKSNAEIGSDLFMAMIKWRRKRKCKCKCYSC